MWYCRGMSLLKTTREPRVCSEAGCDRKHSCKGYCEKHYRHHKNTGILCSISGCGEQHECKGYCKNHYWRFRTHGDPLYAKTNHGHGRTPTEKFWSRVDKSPGLGRDGKCWEWQGKKLKRGYGNILFERKPRMVHHVSWFLEYGQFPVLWLLHSCDNPACVNPEHLREGTYVDNTADMVSRNRQSKGEHRPNSKLKEADILAIRAEPTVWGIQTILSKRYGVPTASISRIRRGLSWKHVR